MLAASFKPDLVLLAVIFLDRGLGCGINLEPIRGVGGWRRFRWRAFKHGGRSRVDTLSPGLTLVVFIVWPVISDVCQLEEVGFLALAHEYWLSAIATIPVRKIVGAALPPRVGTWTRPKIAGNERVRRRFMKFVM